MDSTGLAAITGVALSLLFEYVPGLSVWFSNQVPERKRLVMAGIALLVSLAIFVLACVGQYTAVSCDQAGVWELAQIYLVMLVGNQTTHALAKKP